MNLNITNIKGLRYYLVAGFLLAVTISALSYSTGITGVTGPSQGCSCHGSANGNTTASISSQSGNFTVNPGGTANFTLTVANSSQSAAGTNIAVKTTSSGSTDAGSLSPGSGSGLKNSNSELTHSSAKDFASGQTSFDFSWTAPSTPGVYYLRAVGNAVNKNSQNSGDVWNFATTQQITVPGVSVLTANGGESLCPGASYNITWTSVGVTNVKIELSTNGGSDFSTTLIASTNASAQSWTWNIPSDFASGTQYKIKITDISDNSRNDVSDGNFSIALQTSISAHPTAQETCSKQNINFSVTAQGSNLTYQWRKNSGNLSGKTSSTLVINNVQLSDAGSYDCVVTGACGNPVTSQSAALTVTESPNITTQPVNQTKCPGENATFSVTASAANIAYQWRKNGTDIPGANTNILNLTNVQASDAGNYSVRISGSCDPAVVSNNATLTVNSAPSISTQPKNQSACESTNAQFSITASGSNLTYLWRKNGTNINNSNSSELIFASVSKNDEGEYDVIITGACNETVASSKATLSVKTKPVISSQPIDKTVSVGQKAEFKISSSTPSVQFQWKKNGNVIGNAKDSIYTIPKVTLADSGMYSCSVTNSCGETLSSNAKLTVSEIKQGPSILLSLETADFGTVKVDETMENSYDAVITNSGDENLSISSINISGQNSSEFQLPAGPGAMEIVPGESKDLSLIFAPKSGGSKSAILTFSSNAKNKDTLQLKGFGGVVSLSLSADELNFGDVEIGLSDSQNVNLTNNGNYDVSISEIIVSGTNSALFKISQIETPFILKPAGDSKQFAVTFSPENTGQVTAQIEFKNNVNTELKLNLSANGIISDVDEMLFNSISTVYPNPSSGKLFIKIEQDFTDIEITDNLGRTIKHFNNADFNHHTNSIEWDGLKNDGNLVNSGYYILIIKGFDGVVSIPVIISR